MARIIGTDGGQTVPGGKAETLLPDSTSRDTFTCIFRAKRLERIRLRMQRLRAKEKNKLPSSEFLSVSIRIL